MSSPPLPPPPQGSPEHIAFALGAFTTEIKRWDNDANGLDAAGRGASGCKLKAGDFGLIALIGAIPGEYNQVQQKIQDWLREGSAEFRVIADDLTTTRNAYQDAENASTNAANTADG